jgi:hypothetical protein
MRSRNGEMEQRHLTVISTEYLLPNDEVCLPDSQLWTNTDTFISLHLAGARPFKYENFELVGSNKTMTN